MAIRIVIRPQAVRELTRQARYLARHANPSVGHRFHKAVASTLLRLVRMPESGGVYESENPRLQGIRVCTVKRFQNYMIFYRSPANFLKF